LNNTTGKGFYSLLSCKVHALNEISKQPLDGFHSWEACHMHSEKAMKCNAGMKRAGSGLTIFTGMRS